MSPINDKTHESKIHGETLNPKTRQECKDQKRNIPSNTHLEFQF